MTITKDISKMGNIFAPSHGVFLWLLILITPFKTKALAGIPTQMPLSY